MNHTPGFNGKRDQTVCLANGCLVFLISLIVFQYYTEGDQRHYIKVYHAVSGLGFGDSWRIIFKTYNQWISSVEPVHLLVILVGGGLEINKNLFMSLFNGILAAYSVRLFLSWGASIWIATGLVVTNYYFYVIYFAAERLKFAFLFLILMFLCSKKTRYYMSFFLCQFSLMSRYFLSIAASGFLIFIMKRSRGSI